MKSETLAQLKQFFLAYADQYIERSRDPEPLVLKKDHTLRVCTEILALGKSLGLDENGMMLAETMALFHDLGRFEQYETYRTFLDHQSENHARLSLREIDAHGILAPLSSEEQHLIKQAIAFHNAADLPRLEDDRLLFFMGLLRDADKLDIWRVVIENYTNPRPGSQRAVNLGLVDDHGFSSRAVDAILAGTFVKSACIKRLNDLKLMQISWLFDLNFPQSVLWVKESKYIEKIAATLPDDARVSKAVAHVYEYMDTFVSPKGFSGKNVAEEQVLHGIHSPAGV
ncbi:hypothetical protein SAMN02746065_106185 [Desulfocicer vacuolatum DSM 3385]|uniref:HD domain-containing protein n=1 Tax=Desulfocicer vacuolatum DSM 3385 TaxID=1121400 RepID=A0A1W2AZW5_9BACT|nr:HD domain-containing protein [Desulfocicer vacuolatum]SMC66144.1 hypothetical protein SAMN02746065_106185 [Desulfocicer vacuolatum DSM 3385]